MHPYTKQEITDFITDHGQLTDETVVVRAHYGKEHFLKFDMDLAADEPPIIFSFNLQTLRLPEGRKRLTELLKKTLADERKWAEQFLNLDGLLAQIPGSQVIKDKVEPVKYDDAYDYVRMLDYTTKNLERFLDKIVGAYSDIAPTAAFSRQWAMERDFNALPSLLLMTMIENKPYIKILPPGSTNIASLAQPHSRIGDHFQRSDEFRKMMADLMNTPLETLEYPEDPEHANHPRSLRVVRKKGETGKYEACNEELAERLQLETQAILKTLRQKHYEDDRDGKGYQAAAGVFKTLNPFHKSRFAITYIAGNYDHLLHELGHLADVVLAYKDGQLFSDRQEFSEAAYNDHDNYWERMKNLGRDKPEIHNLIERTQKRLDHPEYVRSDIPLETVALITEYYYGPELKGYGDEKKEQVLETVFPNSWPYYRDHFFSELREVVSKQYHARRPRISWQGLKYSFQEDAVRRAELPHMPGM